MEQEFSLTWNNFQGNLSNGFVELLGNAEFVDVTLAVEGHLIRAHKVILSICSPYFKQMFNSNPCQHPIVVLKDITYVAMQNLLQFMYNGEVSVKQDDLTSFISTANLLQIKGLSEKKNANKTFSQNSSATNNSESTQNSEYRLLEYQENKLDDVEKICGIKRKYDVFLNPKNSTENDNLDKRIRIQEHTNNARSMLQDKAKISYNNTNITEENPGDEVCSNEKANLVLKQESSIKLEYDETNSNEPTINLSNEPQNFTISIDPKSTIIQDDHHNFPERYKYIYSRKGHKQLVYKNFIFTKHSTNHGKTSWRCVQYFSLHRCPATIETISASIYNLNHQHNHDDLHDKIVKSEVFEMQDDCVD